MFIKSISIKNFRSILHENFEAKDLNVIVGNNDVGKSNFLKGFNLFFNGQTDVEKDFNFNNDYCAFAIPKMRKAKEIVIEIIFQPPNNYNEGKNIIWKKTWRKEGFFAQKIKYKDGADIPARSRVKVWLRRIVYKYVPAIKSNAYFSELLKDLHNTLYLTIETELKRAGKKFMENIEKHTMRISKELIERLNVESSIQLPADLSDLFATLDFQTKQGKAEISLKRRGDGIKARYIPIILKFLAEHEKLYHARGAVRSNTIWGYEEPENNLELLKAFELAEELFEYSKNIQIFITTHSPAFYSIGKKEKERVESLFVNLKDDKLISCINPIHPSTISNIDVEMGLLPIITPHIQEQVKKNEETSKRLSRIEEKIKNENSPVLFVEGLTDKTILEKAIKLYEPDLLKTVVIKSKKSAGYNYVKDNLMAWAYLGKKIKVAGLFDFDKNSKKAKVEVDDIKKIRKAKHEKQLKTFLLPKPAHIINIFKKGVSISFSIEELFPAFIWEHAKKQGWLEYKQGLIEENPSCTIDTSFQDFCKKKGLLEHDLYYLKKVKDAHKKEFSIYVACLKGESLKRAFSEFNKLILELKEFFK